MAGKELHGAIRDLGYVGSSDGKGMITDVGSEEQRNFQVCGYCLSISSVYRASQRDPQV